MTYPTIPELDTLLSCDGVVQEGLTSGQILTLVQADTEVGATTLCKQIAAANTSHAAYINIGPPLGCLPCEVVVDATSWVLTDVVNAVTCLLRGGIKVVIVDTLYYLCWSSDLAPELGWQAIGSRLKPLLAEHEAVAILVSGKGRDPVTGNVYFIGQYALKSVSDFIVQMYPEFTLTCVWAPGGCSFSEVSWKERK